MGDKIAITTTSFLLVKLVATLHILALKIFIINLFKEKVDKSFTVGVFVDGQLRGQGSGPSKQAGQVAAAEGVPKVQFFTMKRFTVWPQTVLFIGVIYT